MKPKIEVFSTFAKDIFITETGDIIKEEQGGPATFIQQTLDDIGVEYVMNTAETAEVEILLTTQGEFGRIKVRPTKKQIAPKQANTTMLVSTLLDEWSFPQISARIFLDVQGYVRDGEKFGGFRPFLINPQLESILACVKAEQDEAKYLPQEFVARQKNKQLAITKGSEGVELFIAGERYEISAVAIDDLPDTVGAGDTWFSAYVAYQLQGNDCLLSAKMATTFVAKFLKGK